MCMIISQAGNGTQRVTIGRTRLLHSPLLAKAMHLCDLTYSTTCTLVLVCDGSYDTTSNLFVCP